ncbi:sensor histidine kinase [Leifsonia sp. Leaf264]|uniref:sensor histidine kinase n=1 Tax=Leifsonia sp. Leaf264 TaxID=1736314 RepID=UPI0009E91380|nr:ATP-binding protein [Leifsonia sp. Leaf264]
MSGPGWVSRLVLDSPTPGFKQLPSAAGLLLALIAIGILPEAVVSQPLEWWLGVALVALATIAAFALPWLRIPHGWTIVLPLVTMAGFGLFRVGTGGINSPFGALIILPVVWIASEEGRRHIAIAAAAACIALQLPYLLGDASWNNGFALRGFFTPVIYLIVAAILNDLAHRQRLQIASLRSLADQRAILLADADEHAVELEESEARLRESEQFNRSIWDAVVAESVVAVDMHGLVVAWNPGAERMLGLSADEAVGIRYITDFIDPAQLIERAAGFDSSIDPVNDHDRFAELLEAARASYGDNAEWTYVHADGTHIPVQLSGSPRTDGSGNVAGFIFIGTDLTKAREVNRLKDEFVGMISHELRTPLSSILGYLELIREEAEEPLTPEQLTYLAVAERNANRLLSLVGDLLFTAQVEAGKFPLERQIVELGEIVAAAVESGRPAAERNGVNLIADLPAGQVVVDGDPTRLAQACDNLISNALKFTGRGGSVTVSLAETDLEAVISVQDTGMGIPAAEIDRLFTRFFRSSTATRQAVQGVGLGLSITKAIVTAHHGRMDVASVENEGTTFTISLPRTLVASRTIEVIGDPTNEETTA